MPVNPNPAFLISEDGVICAEIRDRDTKKATSVKLKESDFEDCLNRRKETKTLIGYLKL